MRAATRGKRSQGRERLPTRLELLKQRDGSIHLVGTGFGKVDRLGPALRRPPLLHRSVVLFKLLPIDNAYTGDSRIGFVALIARFIQVESNFRK